MGQFGFLRSSLYNSTSINRLALAAIVATSLAGLAPASARSAWGDFTAAVSKGGGDAGRAIGRGAQDAGRATEKAAHDGGHAIEKGTQDAGKATETAAHDGGHAIEKGTQDTGKAAEITVHQGGYAVEKGVQDMGVAVVAVGDFAVHEVQSMGNTLDDAAKRIREGKIIDAIWYGATDPLKHSEENAAKATQESNILRTVGQVAATAYGVRRTRRRGCLCRVVCL